MNFIFFNFKYPEITDEFIQQEIERAQKTGETDELKNLLLLLKNPIER